MEDLLKLENQVCFPLYAFSREVTNLYRPLLEKIDLTYPQYLVMLVLWEEKQQTVNQIGAKLKLDNGTLTPLLKRMEQKGIISRNRSRVDERVVEVSLTEKGAVLERSAECIPSGLMEVLGIPLEDLQHLKRIVDKMLLKADISA